MADWVEVAGEGECPPGRLLPVKAGKARLVPGNADRHFYALQDRCSHADFPLSDGMLDGTMLECIHHGARFDVCTGAARGLPAIRPVPAYDVEVRDGAVFVRTG